MELVDWIIWISGISIVIVILFIIWKVYSSPKRKQRREERNEEELNKVYQSLNELNKVDPTKEEQGRPEAENIKSYDVKEGKFFNKKLKKQNAKVLKQWQEKAVYIVFQTSGGKYKTWVQQEDDGGFTVKKKKYVFDPDNKVHFVDMGMWGYFFQEQLDIPVNKKLKLNDKTEELVNLIQKQINNEFSKPIDKTIDIGEVKEAIEAYGLAEVESAFDPESLKRFIDTQVILQVMGGAWFTKIMKIVLVLLIIYGFIFIIDIALTGYNTFGHYQIQKLDVFA